MRIAVYGAGGVGGYFGGRLAQAGHEVAFIARGAHLAALQRDGLDVRSTAGDFVVRPCRAAGDPAEVGRVEAVLVCVKAWQVPEIAPALSPLLAPTTFVVPLENGVEAADELAAVVGRERVLGGLCKILSFVEAPGRIRHAAMLPRVEFGERDGSASERVAALRVAFEAASGLSVGTPADIEAAVWEKFLFIAPLSAVGAATRLPAGAFRDVSETRQLLESAMGEVLSLARARGVALRDDVVARAMAAVDALPANGTSSMQRDLAGGKPSELEYQVGAVVRLARRVALPVPVSESLYRVLLPAELAARTREQEGGEPPVSS